MSSAFENGSANLSPMQRIWWIVGMIPAGKVASYGMVADLAGLPKRARYVSRALKQAPDTLDLPWHRVINAQGKISFAADSAPFREQSQRLLSEGVLVNQGKIRWSDYGWQPDIATLVMSVPF
ncbi:cysteine methyltransferase [Shewanella mangrovi]|uniref:Cysteine methyltransferase n=1 Tax=Shewanella mangrovi TaxID=1515746 RepID=A0A094JXT6_9GAMM|nr:MGMT family protein [Shewanella mangrovi]KFZ37246.1 cysteine methyltransferase [Shewanella mangrovi]